MALNVCALCGGYNKKDFCKGCPHFEKELQWREIWVEDVVQPYYMCNLTGLCIEDCIMRYIDWGKNAFAFYFKDGEPFVYGRAIIVDKEGYVQPTREEYYIKYEATPIGRGGHVLFNYEEVDGNAQWIKKFLKPITWKIKKFKKRLKK